MSKQGLKPKSRKLVTKPKTGKKLTANQWQGTPQQLKFMELWLNPTSATFGNSYQSAILAKYSPSYARSISRPSIANEWISEYDRLTELTTKHITQGIQSLALKANNSRSPDDTRLKAYEILAKITGVLNDKGTTTNIVVQPILNGESRKVIEVDTTIVKDTPNG